MAEMPMPRMGDAMEEGTIVKWLKAVGDPVQEDEPIAEIETEKATVSISSLETGILTQILVNEGETVPVGAPIALIEANGKAAAAPAKEAPKAEPSGAAEREAPKAEAGPAAAPRPTDRPADRPAAPQPPTQERLRVSPLARRLADELGVDLARIEGTGPGGRIVEADVREHAGAPAGPPKAAPAPTAAPTPVPTPAVAPAAPAALESEEREMGRIRKIIARRMTESKQTVPHFYITIDVDMRAALDLRQQLNQREGRPSVSITDLILKACALALQRVPAANVSAAGDKIRYHKQVNLGIAVAMEDGLIVPVLHDCQAKSLSQIAQESKPLIERARQGKVTPQELSGATFTISNLGMFDVESFVAIVNPPEAAILAVGSIEERPVVKEGAVVVSPRMKMTLSADHRALDGAVAAQLTQQLKRLLQNPLDLLE